MIDARTVNGIRGLLAAEIRSGSELLSTAAEGDLAPRCVKDEIEERLFERRRDLFTDLSLVFMDTTTLSFHGTVGESLGAHGHSKDHRPDLRQMVLAVVLDGEGRPVCTEMLAGSTADMTVLLPVVDRLRKRFGIGRVCVVADRGMISAATIAALEERGLAYILGARERGTAVIRETVLKNERPFVPLRIERGRGDTQLFVKQVSSSYRGQGREHGSWSRPDPGGPTSSTPQSGNRPRGADETTLGQPTSPVSRGNPAAPTRRAAISESWLEETCRDIRRVCRVRRRPES